MKSFGASFATCSDGFKGGGGGGVKFWPMKSSVKTRLKHIIAHNFVNNRRKYTKRAHMIGHDPPCWFMLIYIGHVTLRMKAETEAEAENHNLL